MSTFGGHPIIGRSQLLVIPVGSGAVTLPANTYDVVVGQNTAAVVVNLPALADTVHGTFITFRAMGTNGVLTVTCPDGAFILDNGGTAATFPVTQAANDYASLVCDKTFGADDRWLVVASALNI